MYTLYFIVGLISGLPTEIMRKRLSMFIIFQKFSLERICQKISLLFINRFHLKCNLPYTIENNTPTVILNDNYKTNSINNIS